MRSAWAEDPYDEHVNFCPGWNGNFLETFRDSPWKILVAGFRHEFYFPFHIWDVILPIDELIFFKMVKSPPTRIIMIYLSIVRFTHQKRWFSIAMLVYQRIIMKVSRALGDFLKEKPALPLSSRISLEEWMHLEGMGRGTSNPCSHQRWGCRVPYAPETLQQSIEPGSSDQWFGSFFNSFNDKPGWNQLFEYCHSISCLWIPRKLA